MEAGGIEPPSEGLRNKAATCLVRVFVCWTRSARGQASRAPSPLSDPAAEGAAAVRFAYLNLTPLHEPIGGLMQDVAD